MNEVNTATGGHDLRRELVDLLGADAVLDDEWSRRFYATDIYSGGPAAAVVVRPGSNQDLANAVRAATAAGFAVIGRGGGTSYTGGIVPDREASVIVDTSGLDRILDINVDDMYVTVESGVTWRALHEALKGTGLRTPYWGPFSGGQATIGGSVSQHSILWGSTEHDISAASVLGLEVALADGSLLTTGSAGWGAKPFFRHFGPDLTGVFLGDSGALGIKTRVTLRLMRRPAVVRMASFNFTERTAMSRAMGDVAREGIAATCFGMDPVLQYQRVKRASAIQGAKALQGLVANADSTFSGIRKAVRVAVAGRRFIDDNGYSFHLVFEGSSEAAVADKLASARRICCTQGSEIESSVPTLLYGDPFVGMTTAIGPDGERWAPMHGLFALSEADAAWAAIEALFERHATAFDRLGIVAGVLLALVSTTVFVVEPVFYWPGPRTIWYDGMLEKSELAKFRKHPPNEEADAAVVEVRKELLALFAEHNAMHMQVGKKYPYLERMDPAARSLVEGIKSQLDPHGLMNPGTLGFGPARSAGEPRQR
jgi:FAD/FMN-containing dehydrogenase